MEHSKTPWKVNICDRAGIWIAAEDLQYVAKAMHEANARRIVAAVNATAHISTNLLEKAAPGQLKTSMDGMYLGIERLEHQRDQLADALRGILAFGIVDDALEKALAALAAIEEE